MTWHITHYQYQMCIRDRGISTNIVVYPHLSPYRRKLSFSNVDNLYLHKLSSHHLRQKRAVLKTLVDRVKRICETRYLDKELRHLKQALQAIGYSVAEVRHAVRLRRSARLAELVSQENVGFAVLPYIHGVTDHIDRLLSWRAVGPSSSRPGRYNNSWDQWKT